MLMCSSVLVKMSICPVIMLFMTANQLHGTITDSVIHQQELNCVNNFIPFYIV